MSNHKASVFIDGSYLDHVILDINITGSKRVDYQALVRAIVEKPSGNRELIRTYYYHCLPYQDSTPTQEQSERFGKMQKFFRALQRTPRFEVKTGRLAYRGIDNKGKPIYEQKRVDLLLGIDLLLQSAKGLIDEAFIVAGDSDFIPAIRAAKAEGVIIYLVYGKNAHDDLFDEVDERIELNAELIGKAKPLI